MFLAKSLRLQDFQQGAMSDKKGGGREGKEREEERGMFGLGGTDQLRFAGA